MELNYDDNTMSWDELFLRHVYLIGSKSRDKSTKIGAVIVKNNRIISSGYNGLPQGVNYWPSARNERPEKYNYYEHAERNAIYSCAKEGISTKDAYLFTNGIACSDCARAIIQSGVKEIAFHSDWQAKQHEEYLGRWTESLQRSLSMFAEAEVNVRPIEKALGIKTLMNGKLIEV